MMHAIKWHGVAELAFWLSVAIVFYVYTGYGLLLATLSIFVRRRHQNPEHRPFLSVVIAAYNEEKGIRKKIEQTLDLDYPADRLEIIVASDGSTDRTDEIVTSMQDPRVRLIRVEGRKGKTAAQNEAVKICKGDVVVFSDATTVYHPQALRYIAANYHDPTVGAVSGRYQYFDAQGSSPTGLGTIAFWNYENLIKVLQSKIRTISGCCGCIYSVRRALYTPLPAEVISDLVQPLHVIRQGYRVVFEDRALAYEETTRSANEEFSMRVRVVTRGIRGLLSVPDMLVPGKHTWVCFQLWSHKILRWLIPLALSVLWGSSLLLWNQPTYRFVFMAQSCFYIMAVLTYFIPLHKRWKVLGIPLYFCILNAAALCSVVEVLRGKKYMVWETVRT